MTGHDRPRSSPAKPLLLRYGSALRCAPPSRAHNRVPAPRHCRSGPRHLQHQPATDALVGAGTATIELLDPPANGPFRRDPSVHRETSLPLGTLRTTAELQVLKVI
jgi:hypothetical protein